MIESDKNTIASLTQQARAGHAELHRLLETIRTHFGTAPEDLQQHAWPTVVAAVKELRDRVDRHFDGEEQGGWLEEAVVHAPYLAHQLTKIERQRAPLRERAADLVIKVEAYDGTTKSVHQVQADFEAFARHLLTHEKYEERVLQAGFNEDLELT